MTSIAKINVTLRCLVSAQRRLSAARWPAAVFLPGSSFAGVLYCLGGLAKTCHPAALRGMSGLAAHPRQSAKRPANSPIGMPRHCRRSARRARPPHLCRRAIRSWPSRQRNRFLLLPRTGCAETVVSWQGLAARPEPPRGGKRGEYRRERGQANQSTSPVFQIGPVGSLVQLKQVRDRLGRRRQREDQTGLRLYGGKRGP